MLNAFFGASAGVSNLNGSLNSFFGTDAGYFNTSGKDNSFFGMNAGHNNTSGSRNTFIGREAGMYNSDDDDNTAVGFSAFGLLHGSKNTFIGAFAGPDVPNLTNATAIGYSSSVSQSNSLVLGRIDNAGTNVGIGTTAPAYRLTVKSPTNNYGIVNTDGTVTLGTFINSSGGWFGTKSNHALNFFVNDGGASLSIDTGGIVRVNTLGAAGSTALCRNASNQISTCSSSLRYKTNIQPFVGGLSVLNHLRPITFDWKQGGMHDLGFGAEEIASVEPLLVSRNDKGEIEGVKYDRISAVLVNAVKEQQEQIKRQQAEIESLKGLVCRSNRRAQVCR